MHWRTETGRLFHSLGQATEKARLPNFRFVRITAKSPRVDDRSPLDLEAEHGVTMDDMYDGEVPEWIDVIHEEGDFECNTGMDGKPVQLFQCRCDVVSRTEIFY